MHSVKLSAIATANPSLKVTQHEVFEYIQHSRQRSRREKKLYRSLLGDPSIETRYFAIEGRLEQLFDESVDAAAARFERQAAALGARALARLLEKTDLPAREVGALIATTCTGYLCPGLSSHVAQAVSLHDHVYALDLVGMGCGAALPAIRTAWQYLRAHEHSNAVVVAVEISSATVHWGDDYSAVLGNAIFGDGAAACLLTNKPNARGLELADYDSLLWPEQRDALRYVVQGGRLVNVIDSELAATAARAFERVMRGVTRDFAISLNHCAVHPGGRKILDAIEALQLPGVDATTLAPSREILRRFGNMSSPSILYVLEELLSRGVRPGDTTGIFAFSAGLTAFGILAVTE